MVYRQVCMAVISLNLISGCTDVETQQDGADGSSALASIYVFPPAGLDKNAEYDFGFEWRVRQGEGWGAWQARSIQKIKSDEQWANTQSFTPGIDHQLRLVIFTAGNYPSPAAPGTYSRSTPHLVGYSGICLLESNRQAEISGSSLVAGRSASATVPFCYGSGRNYYVYKVRITGEALQSVVISDDSPAEFRYAANGETSVFRANQLNKTYELSLEPGQGYRFSHSARSLHICIKANCQPEDFAADPDWTTPAVPSGTEVPDLIMQVRELESGFQTVIDAFSPPVVLRFMDFSNSRSLLYLGDFGNLTITEGRYNSPSLEDKKAVDLSSKQDHTNSLQVNLRTTTTHLHVSSTNFTSRDFPIDTNQAQPCNDSVLAYKKIREAKEPSFPEQIYIPVCPTQETNTSQP